MKNLVIELCDDGEVLPDHAVEAWTKDKFFNASGSVRVANELAITWFQVHVKENPEPAARVSFVLYGVPLTVNEEALLDWSVVGDKGANVAFKRLFGF